MPRWGGTRRNETYLEPHLQRRILVGDLDRRQSRALVHARHLPSQHLSDRHRAVNSATSTNNADLAGGRVEQRASRGDIAANLSVRLHAHSQRTGLLALRLDDATVLCLVRRAHRAGQSTTLRESRTIARCGGSGGGSLAEMVIVAETVCAGWESRSEISEQPPYRPPSTTPK
jgi:hypothetical protein